ncbi:MAG: WS/DGAT domain-containing protein, partial [Halieaceae bacterium]|jgi:hypothetical protein|nr:WS/DGAT domain-containing protein [Halieaceae bacterium]
MNITLSTYDQNVDFGIIACRRSMPQVQRVIDYMEDALVELEDAAGLATPVKKAKPRRKVKAKARSRAKSPPGVKAKASAKAQAKSRTRPKSAAANASKGR